MAQARGLFGEKGPRELEDDYAWSFAPERYDALVAFVG